MFVMLLLGCIALLAMSIIDRSGSSALMPEEASNQIIQGLPAQSCVLSRFRRVTMSRKQTRMPAMAALPVAYFVNGDTGQKKMTDASWENVYLNAEELACIVPIPEAVLDDSNFDIWGEVQPRITEAMGVAVDAAVLFGVNKPDSWPTDICAAAAAAGNTFTKGSVEGKDLADDVNSAMALVEADGFVVNGFAGAPTLKAQLRGLRTTTGEMIFNPGLTAGTPATLYGEPISYFANGAFDATKALLLTGDWSQGILGIRQDITTKILDQAVLQDTDGTIAYNLAQQDMVALRVVFRVAWCMANPINRLQPTKANRYPMSVLRPAGYSG